MISTTDGPHFAAISLTSSTTTELLDEFPENQLLSGLVKKINECLKKNDEKDVIVKTLNSKFIVHKDENEYNNNINSILNDNNMILVN